MLKAKDTASKNQPDIAMWNLIQLANAIYTLIDDTPALEEILNDADMNFVVSYRKMRQEKLGLTSKYDNQFHNDLESNLIASETDMTIFYRNLATILKSDTSEEAFNKVAFSFYNPNEIEREIKENWLQWFQIYLDKLSSEPIADEERKLAMNTINPKYVLRNYMAQLAIDAAEKEDYSIIDELYTLLKNPYDEQPENDKWFAKRPDWARNRVGCSMLSCSS